MARHDKTVEIGGWVLLLAAIAFLLYLCFHRDGQAALSGTVVSSTVGGQPTHEPTVIFDNTELGFLQ